MSISDRLNKLLGANQIKRLAQETEQTERGDSSSILRHTTYQGDRKIKQLGEDTIENGVILNNQSLAIGDVMLPLAKGNVLRRVDNTNGGALLGSAYRKAVENDFDANRDRRNKVLSRNGGDEPSNPPSSSDNPKSPTQSPPPFGCNPPPSSCFWSTDPIAPDGFQGYGDAVVNENAQPLYLYCAPGTAVPSNLDCDFLNKKYSCSGGVCSPSLFGIYNSLAECEAALVPPTFTGGQCLDTVYTLRMSWEISNDFGGTWFNFDDTTNYVMNGKIVGIRPKEFSGGRIGWAVWRKGSDNIEVIGGEAFPTFTQLWRNFRIRTITGSPDDCGNAPPTCPI